MIGLIESLLTVTGAIVISSPIAYGIVKLGNVFEGDDKNKNKSQAKRNKG